MSPALLASTDEIPSSWLTLTPSLEMRAAEFRRCTERPDECRHHWRVGVMSVEIRGTGKTEQRCFVFRECGTRMVWVSCEERDGSVSQATLDHAWEVTRTLDRVYGLA